MDDSRHNNSVLKHRDLVERYVGVCNEALLRNSNRFPFKQILGAARDAEHGQAVEVVVTDSSEPEAYVFHLKGDGITAEPHGSCENCQCARSWNTNTSYLRDVVSDSDSYIQNPAKINWEWMFDA